MLNRMLIISALCQDILTEEIKYKIVIFVLIDFLSFYNSFNEVTVINLFSINQLVVAYSFYFIILTYFIGQKQFVMLCTRDDKNLHANKSHL